MSVDADILAELRRLRVAIETLSAQLNARTKNPAPTPPTRNAYTVDQFSAEVLGGLRLPAWVRAQCRLKEIRTVAKRPYLIPAEEAARFSGHK